MPLTLRVAQLNLRTEGEKEAPRRFHTHVSSGPQSSMNQHQTLAKGARFAFAYGLV